ncbi:MAG: SURF1 family protein [Xanthomonadales bacterium]|nr:SURF1 family protein [Xanthomonadales bacterium]
MTPRVSRSFRPSLPVTLILALLAVLFASLGSWQIRRAAEKAILETEHQHAPSLALDTALATERRFARVETSGHYDPQRHILLDNQLWQGRGGVHVFTPFVTSSGTAILVNRGWLPLPPDRRELPAVPTPAEEVTVRGMLNDFPVPGRMVGEADRLETDRWPQLVTYMRHADIARVLGLPLETHIIQLSRDAEHGFEDRDWKPVFLSAERHRAYAFQWYALLAACVILWLLVSLRKTRVDDT